MEGIENFADLSNAKGFKIVHLNVCSIVKKIDQLRLLLADSKIDILTVSETWMRPHIHTELVDIQGCSASRLDRSIPGKENKKGWRTSDLCQY